jgi:hypothetical protein
MIMSIILLHEGVVTEPAAEADNIQPEEEFIEYLDIEALMEGVGNPGETFSRPDVKSELYRKFKKFFGDSIYDL